MFVLDYINDISVCILHVHPAQWVTLHNTRPALFIQGYKIMETGHSEQDNN